LTICSNAGTILSNRAIKKRERRFGKMAKGKVSEDKISREWNDYSGPLQNNISFDWFSKEFLLKLMRIWQEHWVNTITAIQNIGSQMEGVGPAVITELTTQALETSTPPIMAQIAELCKVDINTIEGRIKPGQLGIDDIPEAYPATWEVKSDKEAILTYHRCDIIDRKKVDSLEMLLYVCNYLEPRYAMAYQNYPGVLPKVKVTMLKLPESLTPKPGEPVCVWKFAFEE
jgi:hypothetical protein